MLWSQFRYFLVSVSNLRSQNFPVSISVLVSKKFYGLGPELCGLDYITARMSAATVEPIDVYSIMVTDDVYDLIVEQTNLNVQQVLIIRPIKRSSRLKT